jgi:MFS family permease
MIRLTEAGLCLASGALVANSLFGRPQLWVLFVVSGVFAAVDGLQRPSLAAIVPQIVRPEQLPATSAVMSMQSKLGMIAAPALTGVIIAVGGLTLTYSLDVASYLVSLVFLLLLGAMPPPPGESDLSLAAIRAGMSYAWQRKDLLGSYLVDMNAMFFGMPNALFPRSPPTSAAPPPSACSTLPRRSGPSW